MNKTAPSKKIRRLLIYLGIALAVISIFGYFMSAGIENERVKSFIEDFCSNSFGALVAFLGIAIFLENYNLSWGQNSFDEAADKIGEHIDKNLDFEELEPYTLMGLKSPEKRNLFQDFLVDRTSLTGNINAVSFLWADTLCGDSINAKIMEESGRNFLRTSFEVHEKSFGCNLSIRPQNERPVYLKDSGLNFLSLQFRIPEVNFNNNENLQSIGVAVLVINGLM